MKDPELSSDFSMIQDSYAAQHPAWHAFKRQMIGRVYSRRHLNDAWGWFKIGWENADEEGR